MTTATRAVLVDDPDEARELHRAFMAGCVFPGEDHQFWKYMKGERIIGMCSAVVRPEKFYVYLSSAGVSPYGRKLGIQRRMIRLRCDWGKRQGATHAVTYTLVDNYPSIVNLLKCGFRFAFEPRGWVGVGPNVHYFEKEL